MGARHLKQSLAVSKVVSDYRALRSVFQGYTRHGHEHRTPVVIPPLGRIPEGAERALDPIHRLQSSPTNLGKTQPDRWFLSCV